VLGVKAHPVRRGSSHRLRDFGRPRTHEQAVARGARSCCCCGDRGESAAARLATLAAVGSGERSCRQSCCCYPISAPDPTTVVWGPVVQQHLLCFAHGTLAGSDHCLALLVSVAEGRDGLGNNTYGLHMLNSPSQMRSDVPLIAARHDRFF
jgi:hypothetical protein